MAITPTYRLFPLSRLSPPNRLRPGITNQVPPRPPPGESLGSSFPPSNPAPASHAHHCAARQRPPAADGVPQGSFWIHDTPAQSPAYAGRPCGHIQLASIWPVPRLCPLSRRSIAVLAAVLTAVLVVGAIVGAIVGSRAARAKGSPHPPMTSGLPKNNPGNEDSVTLLAGARSQLATWLPEKSAPETVGRLLVFQDADGDLAISQWHKDKVETYRLRRRLADLPKPLLGAPLRLLPFGRQNDLHLFYLDQDRLLRHLMRPGGGASDQPWQIDSTFSQDGPQRRQAQGYCLATAVFPALDGRSGDGFLAVLYWNGDGQNSFTMLTAGNPDQKTRWVSTTIVLSAPAAESNQSLRLQHDSPGLLLLPKSTTSSAGELVPSLRVIWDLANETHSSSLGFFDCEMRGRPTTVRCSPQPVPWKDQAVHQRLLSAQKPLQLTRIDLQTGSTVGPLGFVLAVLDNAGRYFELLWDGDAWAGLRDFSDAQVDRPGSGAKPSFSGLAPTQNGLLFATSQGELAEYSRNCAWWAGQCLNQKPWKFLKTVNNISSTTPPDL